ncbi:unknown [Firmicutes bacterium CAG:95]|nr:unknown [Firmicutes bacterium CAG:95]
MHPLGQRDTQQLLFPGFLMNLPNQAKWLFILCICPVFRAKTIQEISVQRQCMIPSKEGRRRFISGFLFQPGKQLHSIGLSVNRIDISSLRHIDVAGIRRIIAVIKKIRIRYSVLLCFLRHWHCSGSHITSACIISTSIILLRFRENTAISFCFPTVTARDFRNLNHRGTTAQTKCKQSGYSCPDKFLHPLPPFITILLSCRLLNRH